MRSYERSHSWLKFEVDLRRLQYDIWVALGEAQSKCEHISRAPLRPDTAKNLHQIFLAKGVRGTTAIEGNTLSEEEVLKQLDGQLDLPPSKEYLGQETKNIIDACNEIADAVVEFGLDDLTPTDIKLFNSRVLRDLPPEESVTPGEIRSHSVGVAGARYLGAPAEDCDYLLERLCDWLRTDFD
ncbi:MAG: Fic family protein, partial [bacterium]|nr:Fic family protein [bacterium]